jgi:hypothetical protein
MFFVTNEWHNDSSVKLEKLATDKHSSLLQVVKKMKCCKYDPRDLILNTYEWAQKATALHYTSLKMLPSDKHSSLFGAFIRYEKIMCCE